MATRRERTTGLPRAKERIAAAGPRRFSWLSWSERHTRIGIIGGAVVLLLVILGAFSYNVYQEQIGRPNSTVLSVGDESYNLRYYADRLYPFLQANLESGNPAALLEEDLLNRLEREALTVRLARERSIDLGEAPLTAFVAQQLGAEPGGSGTPFDSLYRQQLRTLGMSADHYQTMMRAALANQELLKQLSAEVGTSGEQATLRLVVVSSEDAASAILARAEGGEDLGTIAQSESIDLESRQQNGLIAPEPIELFPANVKTAIEGAAAGDVLGPIEVNGNWWVFAVDSTGPLDYSEEQRTQLAGLRLTALVNAERSELSGEIKRSLDPDDIKWAEENLG